MLLGIVISDSWRKAPQLGTRPDADGQD